MDKKLKLLLGLTLLSIPLYVIRCKTFYFCVSPVPFTLLEVLIVITFVFWVFKTLKENKNPYKYFKKLFEKIPLSLKVAIGFFLLSAFVSVFISPDRRSALGIFKAYFIEPLLLGIVIFDFLDRSKDLNFILFSFLGSGVWLSLIGIFERVFGFSPFNTAEFFSRGRVGALYTSSNALALYVVPLFFIALGILLHLKNKSFLEMLKEDFNFRFVSIFLTFLFLGAVVSGSRGGFLALLAGLAFFTGFNFYKKFNLEKIKNIQKIFIGFVVLFFLVWTAFIFNLQPFINLSQKNPVLKALEPRLCLWQGTANQLKQRLVLGDGLHGFQTVNKDFHTCSQEVTLYPHNLILNFWVETGFVGLISFIAIAVYFFFNFLKSEKLDYLNLGFASVLIAYLFHGLVDVPFFNNDTSTAFWVFLSIGLFLINEKNFFRVRKVNLRQ